jgi:hypothetical protein
MNIPDILQYMGVIERPRTIRIVQLASRFIAVWFAAAGAVHLAENSGDFFCNFENAQELDVFNAIYFMIVTMTTVRLRKQNEFCFFVFLINKKYFRLVMEIFFVKHILENFLCFYF